MMIAMRDTAGNLCSKGILDVNMDMSLTQNGGKFEVKVNQNYTLNEKFDNKEDAEEKILELTALRNSEENTLLNEG